MYKKIVIAGGGTAGWMTAALMAKTLVRAGFEITLVESANIPTVGVGEATVPSFMGFNRLLGIDEKDLVKKIKATYKLGIMFDGWESPGKDYIHGFGALGDDATGIPFYHYWLRWQKENPNAKLEDVSICQTSARKNRFIHPNAKMPPIMRGFGYALHIDAGLYANYLRDYATEQGITHLQADIAQVSLNATTGAIDALIFEDGNRLDGDFFIDCTGFRSLLLGDALQVPYISWKQWLKCDRAQVVPTALTEQTFVPYTKSTAHKAGWQWRIPLQHRAGNGLVYSSQYMDDDEATSLLMSQLQGEPLAEPRVLKFEAGMRERSWYKNCAAIGLSAGFVEPLESTSIHLIQTTIQRLINLFPNTETNDVLAKRFNQQTAAEMELIRDFIILHYCVNKRDEPFWRDVRDMQLPDSLRDKLELFQKSGFLHNDEADLFADSSWISVALGQGIRPENTMCMIDSMTNEQLQNYMRSIKQQVATLTDKMPLHRDYLAQVIQS